MSEDREKLQSSGTKKRVGPLRLLDLPLDILKEIVKEITLTNDLASLALTHSALHQLAIPHIYSRFDIVWPDKSIEAEPRSGVDALTYGLATLVMNEDILRPTQTNRGAESRGYCERCTCDDCNLTKSLEKSTLPPTEFPRRGNRFSQYVRKFSLGNGPPEWVQEYLITKEGGKMLGTLIALAAAHMPNLETFIWDMPTGILRDVWISLSSPTCREKGLKPKLKKFWVRFHNNKEMNSEPSLPNLTAIMQNPTNVPDTTQQSASENASPLLSKSGYLFGASFGRIEHPNLSILPPLSSLSVLDIDEFAYLWEMSILIRKSMQTLRELRIGMASYLSGSGGWASDKMIDAIGPVGVIGTIMASMFIYFDKAGNASYQPPTDRSSPKPDSDASHQGKIDPLAPSAIFNFMQECSSHKKTLQPSGLATETTPDEPLQAPSTDNLEGTKPSLDLTLQIPVIDNLRPSVLPSAQDTKKQDEALNLQEGTPSSRKLHLEVLEVERVSLNVFMLLKAIDWSVLSSLTLLCCGCHEQLWKALRRDYAPRSAFSERWQRLSSQTAVLPSSSKCKSSSGSSDPSPAYQLKLKKIHTDAVSPALVAFLKDALAPNSLEWLFLQDGRAYISPVTLDTISRGPIRYHRASLKKLMIDSAIGKPEVSRNQKRKKWMFNRDLITFITSGKMCRLKELTMNISYSDWHFFLQRLPRIPHLCSLHIPHVADYVDGTYVNAKELALQLVDVVAIRPEIQLLYIGLSNSCFELVESLERDESKYESHSTTDLAEPGETSSSSEDTDDDVDEHGSGVDQSTNNQNPAEAQPEASTSNITSGDSAYDVDDSDEDANEREKTNTVLKLREILFYDDKISIFKARHGRL